MESSASEKKFKCNRKTVCISVLVLLVLGGAAAGLTYWLTRPEDIPITTAASNGQSPPSLVQASGGGAVRIDSSFVLADPSNVTNYLTIDNATLSSLTDDTALYFVPNLDAVDFEASGENFIVPEIKLLDYPHALPPSFDPSLYEGGVFASRSNTEGVMVVDMFDWVVDTTSAEDDGASDTVDTSIPGGGDESDATAAPGDDEGTTNTVATDAPTPSPTSPTTAAPVPQPTLSPTVAAQEDPITLFSELGGGGYNVGGTITLQYRTDIDNNGNVINVPFLLFENINPVSAPGPFLWMTRRANARHSQILENDIYIAIDGTEEGSFTKGGTYAQDFYAQDFPEPNVDFSEFVGGSYIVWCEPFSVWIGGGDIVELS